MMTDIYYFFLNKRVGDVFARYIYIYICSSCFKRFMCARYTQLPDSNKLQCLSDLYLFLKIYRQTIQWSKKPQKINNDPQNTVTEKTND